jgi:hypothetical protein
MIELWWATSFSFLVSTVYWVLFSFLFCFFLCFFSFSFCASFFRRLRWDGWAVHSGGHQVGMSNIEVMTTHSMIDAGIFGV